jgi:hypothetical protein
MLLTVSGRVSTVTIGSSALPCRHTLSSSSTKSVNYGIAIITRGHCLLYRTYSAKTFFLLTQGAAGGPLCPGLICVVPSGLRKSSVYQAYNFVVYVASWRSPFEPAKGFRV